MIIGIGTDLVEIARIESFWRKHQQKFANKLLSASELEEFARLSLPIKFLAKRWAAKEAISKALGTGISQGISFDQITILHDQHGKPLVHLSGIAAATADQLGIKHWHLSISDEKNYAIAYVIAEG